MANIFFERLPIETRNQIYEELLLSHDAINDFPNRRTGGHDSILYPNILRICKQVFAEASIVLYEKNRFRYSSNPVHRPGIYQVDLSINSNFSRIKHLEIAFSGNARVQRTSERNHYEYKFLETTTAMLRLLKNLGCSLKTIRMDYTFDRMLNFYQALAFNFEDGTYHVEVAKKLALENDGNEFRHVFMELDVEQSIELCVNAYDPKYCSIFKDFAGDLARKQALVLKGPTFDHHVLIDDDNKEMIGPARGNDRYVWTWRFINSTQFDANTVPGPIGDSGHFQGLQSAAAGEIEPI